ncbi:MAG: MetQ/NlpA family ABC transporter substrate-binding protein [Legionellales bacterium]|nr:MetQ/NlpA family ABC transporter substrate-binding protein [Legionellales bacterium]
MRFGKKTALLTILTSLIFILAGCHKSNNNNTVIKVGTIAGPETQLMAVAKTVAAKKYGLDIEIITFSDYNTPNEALNDGSIDANAFQHLPYLQQSMTAHGYKLKAIAKTFIYPMGLYSKRYHTLADIPQGTLVAIPNDPSNEARALLLLQNAGLITLKEGGNDSSTPIDILTNPKQLKIKPIDAPQLPRTLQDVGLAAINTNYAVLADLLPERDALFVESKNSPYANLIVVRADGAETINQQHLVDAFHSPEVVEAAKKLFKGQAMPAW